MSEEKSSVLDWFSRRLNLTEIFSLLTSYGIYYGELDSRKPLREALDEARQRPVALYSRWPRVLSLITVVLIALELLTGGLLALYYLPTPGSAHPSLGTILRDVHFGAFVHQMHFWGGQLLILVLMLRVIRNFLGGFYLPPKELIWVFGALLLLVAFHLDLTGRALLMTDQGYWSSVRALEIVGWVPIYGPLIHFLVGGGGAFITELTLIRFYILHVAVLPIAAITLIYLHFSSIRRVGLGDPGQKRVQPKGVMRNQLLTLAIILTLVFGLLVTLAVMAPKPFHREADPFTTVPGIGPPWYLLAPFGFIEWMPDLIPQWLAGLVLFLAFTVFLLIPFLHRAPKGTAGRRIAVILWLLVMLTWALFSVYGARVA
jgi:quinol-cytochrome oxidoreductase complex cytochrome b subunit